MIAQLDLVSRGHHEAAVGGFDVPEIGHRTSQERDALAPHLARVRDPAVQVCEAVLAREEIRMREIARGGNHLAYVDEGTVLEVDARPVGEDAGGIADHASPEIAGALTGALVQHDEALVLAEFEAVARRLLDIGLPVEDGVWTLLAEFGECVRVAGELALTVDRCDVSQGGFGCPGSPGSTAEYEGDEGQVGGQALARPVARRSVRPRSQPLRHAFAGGSHGWVPPVDGLRFESHHQTPLIMK